jgi:AAA ATPase-like protein
VRAEGGLVLAGRCDEDMGVPYQPFVEALRHYVTHAPDPRLGRFPGELTRLVPDLPDLVPGLPEPLRSDPDTERYRLFDALASWFSDMSADTPVLVVLDDLHWAAGPTVLLLRHVLRSDVPLRLLMVATYRDTDLGRNSPLGPGLAELRRLPGAECLALTGLDQAGVEAFLEALAGHAIDGEDGESLVRAVWEGTEGNPFFVGETLRHLSESGAVARQDDRWVVTVQDLGIPPGVRDVVGTRLSRLSDQANRALAAAAVAGLEFEPEVVRVAAGLGEEDLATALDEALAAHVVVEVHGMFPRNRFAHALVRATVYDEQNSARKVMLHRKVAEAIETIHAGALDDHLPALAHHCARSAVSTAEKARAVDYAARAGDRALAQLAPQEAVTFYRSALELLVSSGEPADEDRRSDLMISLGDAQQQAGDPDHRETLLAEARQAQHRGDGPRLIRAVLANYRGSFSSAGEVDAERVATLEAALDAAGDGDDLLRARLLSQLVMEQAFAAGVEQRQRQSAEALALARRAGDPEVLIRAINARVFATWHPSGVRERLALGEEAFSIRTEGLDPGQRLLTMTRASFARMEVGDRPGFEGILALLEAAISDVVHPYLRCIALLKLGTARLMHGDFEAAERFCDRGAAVGEASGVLDTHVYVLVQRFGIAYERGRLEPWMTGPLTVLAEGLQLPAFQVMLGVVHAELGQTAEAAAVLDRLVETGFECLPWDLNWGPSLALAATLCHHLHHQRGATAIYQLIEPYSDLAAGHSLLFAGGFSHALGLLATTLGHYDEVEARFAAALALHERLDAPVWLARTRLEWGRMLAQRGSSVDDERARGLLGQALDFGRHLPQPVIEARAAAALREIAEP